MIIESLIHEPINSRTFKSFDKVINCLLSPTMHDVIRDIEFDQEGHARNAYLSLIMFMPLNKYTLELNKKIQLSNQLIEHSSSYCSSIDE